MMTVYVPDTAFFVEAARRGFPLLDGSPFWESLARLAAQGRLQVIDKVQAELDRESAALKEWLEEHLRAAVVSTNVQATADSLRAAMRWVYAQTDVHPVAAERFARSSAVWVLAHALGAGATVLTYPVPEPAPAYLMSLEVACRAFGVPVAFASDLPSTGQSLPAHRSAAGSSRA